MPDYKEHITNAGARWDTVAAIEYGDALLMGKIRDANPDVESYDVFPGGIILQVPIIAAPASKTDESKMPPWKQQR